MRTSLRLTSALIILFIANQAQAQFNAPIRYNEGPGVKLSDSLVFHPGIEVEGRYDSNALYTNTPIGAPYLRFIGHLDLATLPPQRLTDGDGAVSVQKVDFRFTTALGYREYISDNEAVQAQRALEIDAGIRLALFPQSVFSFAISDNFQRTTTARGNENAANWTRDVNRAKLNFTLAPGGRRITFDLGYSFNFDLFEEAALAGANKLYHDLDFEAKWRLLPKTAIGLYVKQQFVGFTDPTAGGFNNVDSSPFRVWAGLVGLITPHLSTVLKVGYGNGLYSTGNSFSSVLAVAELGFIFGPFAKLRVGFSRDFQDSMYDNYFTDNKVYLRYDHFIASRVLLHLDGRYAHRGYGGGTISGDALTQNVVGINFGADYQIKEWIYVGIGYDMELNARISGPTSGVMAPDFNKHQVFGKVGISY